MRRYVFMASVLFWGFLLLNCIPSVAAAKQVYHISLKQSSYVLKQIRLLLIPITFGTNKVIFMFSIKLKFSKNVYVM